MEIRILLLMVLCHIIDDFVLQPICLSKLKQKEWWDRQLENKTSKEKKLYANDYKTALFIHALSWSIMISLPLIFMTDIQGIILPMVALNTMIHYLVDDTKANDYLINLTADQTTHILQILVYWLIYVFSK